MDSEPQRSGVPAEFWRELAAAQKRLLIIDYDGTLAPFTVQRDAAWPYSGVCEALQEIQDAGTRIVVITGRTVEELRKFLPIVPPPEVWGSHGHVRLLNGEVTASALTAEAEDALREAERCALGLAIPQAVESKPACVAVHWRGGAADQAQFLEKQLRKAWEPLTGAGLSIHNFDGGLELRSNAMDKGRVVNQLLAELGSNYVAAYLGDDLTDEDAFAALDGKGLTVLVRPEWRETKAQAWLKPPQELLAFLRQWNEGSRGRA